MSLKDTIRGAREEAAANGSPFDRAGASGDEQGSTATTSGSEQGFARSSAASRKPSRAASAGVRVVSANGKTKSKSKMTKEEAKAERKHEREVEDQRYNVAQMILEDTPTYQEKHKVWKRFLIAGATLTVIALATYFTVANSNQTAPMWLAAFSMVTMIAAYLVIIVGFIYDWRNIRPLKKAAEKRAASMSEKRIRIALTRGKAK